MEVSIIIPAHNSEKTIGRALGRIIEIGLGDKRGEVIVVENNSNDRTSQIVAEYERKHSFVKMLQTKKRGAGAARNLGAQKASGEVLIFIDSDILIETGLISAHRDFILGSREKIVSIGKVVPQIESADKDFLFSLLRDGGHIHGEEKLSKNRDNLPYLNMYTGNFAVLNSTFKQTGGFDEDFISYGMEDLEFGCRFKKNGGKLKYNNRAVGRHIYLFTFDEFCRKKELAGESLAIFVKKHPGIVGELKPLRIYVRYRYLLSMLFSAPIYWLAKILRVKYYLINAHYFYGIRKGMSNG